MRVILDKIGSGHNWTMIERDKICKLKFYQCKRCNGKIRIYFGKDTDCIMELRSTDYFMPFWIYIINKNYTCAWSGYAGNCKVEMMRKACE